MKRLAIITLCLNNYGTRLQSYALCKILNRILGGMVNVEVINIEGTWTGYLSSIGIKKHIFGIFRSYGSIKCWGQYLDTLVWLLQKIFNSKPTEDWILKKKKRDIYFDHFNSFIPYTSKIYSCEDIREHQLPKYDAYLVGSDQVWNGLKVGNQDVFMLDFLDSSQGLTYAASFGMTEIPPHMKDDYKRHIMNFKSLLIREEEGVRLCHELGRDDANLVLDPTLLLGQDEYSCLFDDDALVEGKFILLYSLNQSLKIYREVYKLCKETGYKMVVLKRSFCPPKIEKYKGAIELFDVSPGGFLWLIKNAQCVITNSYHAMLFSINFNRPFYLYLNNADEENSRLLTVARRFKLGSRVFWESGTLPCKIESIDYSNANSVLESERHNSLKLLTDSLDTVGLT